MAFMTETSTNAKPRQSFWVTSHATGWWWYQNGSGWLNCFDGRLRFDFMGLPLIKRVFKPRWWEHTNPRIVLASPSLPFPNHFTILIFEQGKVAVSIPGNRELLRTTLADCGFQIVEMPPRSSWPRKLRAEWEQYGEPPQ